MILAALLSAPARAQPLPGAEKMAFADMVGWWLAAPGAAPRPAAISLHRCDGLHPRNEPDAPSIGSRRVQTSTVPASWCSAGRAAVAFSPDCSPYGRTQGSYLPVAPLLILLDGPEERIPAAPCLELGKWTPKVMVQVLPESGQHAALFEFLERELR